VQQISQNFVSAEQDESAGITQLRARMGRDLGVIRNGPAMEAALGAFLALEEQARSVTLKGMAQVAIKITKAALAREESRGGHFRDDFPQANAALVGTPAPLQTS
jgi:L-aspartate oxidase